MRSLSEIETAVKRASRAVGFSWGNSEEVGKSVRQLELFGLKGIKNLNQYYKEKETKKFEDLNLISETNETSLEAYCPIILGISFLDQIKTIEKQFKEKYKEQSTFRNTNVITRKKSYHNTPKGLSKLLFLNWPVLLLVFSVSNFGFLILYSVADGSLQPWAKPQMIRFGIGFVVVIAFGFVHISFWQKNRLPAKE